MVRPVLARRARLVASQRESPRRRARPPSAGRCRRRRAEPRSLHGACAGADARALPLPVARARPGRRRGPGRGKARRPHRDRRGSGAGQRSRHGRRRGRRHPVHARVPGRRHRRLAVGGDAAAEPREPRRAGPRRRLDARGLGSPRRALASRPSPLAQGIDQAAGGQPGFARRSPTRTFAIASSPSASSRPPRPWSSSCSTCRPAWARNTASSRRSFFFWAVQGLRRQYRQLEVVFIAHTTEAWEFAEEEFFRVTGSGGTFMSTALTLSRGDRRRAVQPVAVQPLSLLRLRRGELAQRQRRDGRRARRSCSAICSYCGFLEVGLERRRRSVERHRQALPAARRRRAARPRAYRAAKTDDIWGAVRHFFGQQQAA